MYGVFRSAFRICFYGLSVQGVCVLIVVGRMYIFNPILKKYIFLLKCHTNILSCFRFDKFYVLAYCIFVDKYCLKTLVVFI